MKAAVKIGLFTAGLCVVTSAIGIWLYFVQTNRSPGRYGGHLEFRVAAMNTRFFGFSDPPPQGFDVFSVAQAEAIAASGAPPAGFKWMPVSNFYLMITGGGNEPRGVLTMINGHKCLLVADRPEMMLTHAVSVPAWGAKSVEMTATYKFGPVVKAVQVTLDHNGRDLLRQFTQRYVRHSIAVIVDGQVIVDFGLLTPLRRGVLGFSYPEGAETEAAKLRDSLMQ